jgi:DnaJ-class molecular chaperone
MKKTRKTNKNTFLCEHCNKTFYSKNKSIAKCSTCGSVTRLKQLTCSLCNKTYYGGYLTKFCNKCSNSDERKKLTINNNATFKNFPSIKYNCKGKKIDKKLKDFILSYWLVNNELAIYILNNISTYDEAVEYRNNYFSNL